MISGTFSNRTRYRVYRLIGAHVLVPREHPTVKVSLFVEQTSNHDEGRYRVQNGKYSNPYHELLEFVGLRTVVLHDRAYSEERYETCEKKSRPENEIDAKGSKYEATQCLDVPKTDVTHTREYVAWNDQITKS